MKIGIVAIALTLFHNHALVHKELVKRHKDIASTLVTYTCVTLFQCRYHIGIALYNLLAETALQCFPVLLFRQLCKRKVPVLFGLLEYITVHDFGQSVVIDAKCERVKLTVTYMHRLYFAYIAVLRAFRDLQDGFSFVVQLCTNMSSCVIIPLVQMQYGMDMQVIST